MDIAQMTASEAMDLLRSDPDAHLVDVRSRAEYAFVGIPDLSGLGRQVILLPIRDYPDMQPEPNFAATLSELVPDEAKSVCFICRSGARSLEAAQLFAPERPDVSLVNVSDGFEGDLDPAGHRGQLNGWKSAGLPWRQS